MSWARFDDQFHSGRKIRRAWKRDPSSVGLYAMAITYCCAHHTDGEVPEEFVDDQFKRPRDMEAAVGALVDAGLWVPVDGGWCIPDFLEYNESRADWEAKRERNAANGRRGGEAKSKRTAKRVASESLDGRQAGSVAPTRPDPTRTRPVSPNGETTDSEVVVVPPQVKESDEVERACDVLAAAGVHVHDRSTITRLAGEHQDVDIVEASIRAANWARGKRVKHPVSLLRQFVDDENAPKRGEVPQPKGRRHLSPVDHYAAIAAEVAAEREAS